MRTARLLLREWRDEDREPFAAMGQDPEVMAHFPALLTREASDAGVERVRAHFEREGFGLWAVEVVGGAPFIGWCGLQRPRFMPEVIEIGWRLARAHWGHGYATEAARTCVEYAFDTLGLDEIVAFVVRGNARSHAVCKRLGMTLDPADDFAHPLFAVGARSLAGDDLHHHHMYRLTRAGRNATPAKVEPFTS